MNGLEPKRPQDQNDAPRIGEARGDVGVIAAYIHSRAGLTYSLAVARNRATLDLLARAVDSLRLAPGRKAAILLSKGFIYDTNLRGFKDVSRAAREANVAIFFVDARGLEAGTSQSTAEAIGQTDARDIGWATAGIELEAAGAVTVAEETGGFAVRNTNDLSAGIRRIADESRSYYLVGYTPRESRRDGRFHKIQVRVNRPGLTVRARKGYYAPDDREPRLVEAGLDPDVLRALDAPRDLGDVPVRAAALVFGPRTAETASVMIAAETDVRRFAFEPANDRLADVMEFGVAVTHLETGAVSRSAQTVDMAVRPETLLALEQTWYPLSREFQLPPGPYAARVVVRDRRGDRIGSVTHRFEVPPLQGFRISTPILSDRVETPEGAASPRPVLMAHRTFPADATLYCQFAAYNAAVDPSTGRPRVSSSWKLQTGDGRPVRESAPREMTPGPDNGLVRLYGVKMSGLSPGECTSCRSTSGMRLQSKRFRCGSRSRWRPDWVSRRDEASVRFLPQTAEVARDRRPTSPNREYLTMRSLRPKAFLRRGTCPSPRPPRRFVTIEVCVWVSWSSAKSCAAGLRAMSAAVVLAFLARPGGDSATRRLRLRAVGGTGEADAAKLEATGRAGTRLRRGRCQGAAAPAAKPAGAPGTAALMKQAAAASAESEAR